MRKFKIYGLSPGEKDLVVHNDMKEAMIIIKCRPGPNAHHAHAQANPRFEQFRLISRVLWCWIWLVMNGKKNNFRGASCFK